MATPSPTPYSSTKYDVSDGADGFHNLPGRTDNEFQPDTFSYWLDIFIVAGMPWFLVSYFRGLCALYLIVS